MTYGVVHNLLEKLSIEIEQATIFSNVLVSFNSSKLENMIDRIRAALPGEIQEARMIIKRREEIQIEAQDKADRIIAEAKAHAEKILSESELLKAVQVEADRVRAQVIADCENLKRDAYGEADRVKNTALRDSATIRDGAEQYAQNILENLDKDLTQMMAVVKNGQYHMSKMKAETEDNLSQFQIEHDFEKELS